MCQFVLNEVLNIVVLHYGIICQMTSKILPHYMFLKEILNCIYEEEGGPPFQPAASRKKENYSKRKKQNGDSNGAVTRHPENTVPKQVETGAGTPSADSNPAASPLRASSAQPPQQQKEPTPDQTRPRGLRAAVNGAGRLTESCEIYVGNISKDNDIKDVQEHLKNIGVNTIGIRVLKQDPMKSFCVTIPSSKKDIALSSSNWDSGIRVRPFQAGGGGNRPHHANWGSNYGSSYDHRNGGYRAQYNHSRAQYARSRSGRRNSYDEPGSRRGRYYD